MAKILLVAMFFSFVHCIICDFSMKKFKPVFLKTTVLARKEGDTHSPIDLFCD